MMAAPTEVSRDQDSSFFGPGELESALHVVTKAAASLASFCEHVEHNEPNSIEDPLESARCLRATAAQLAAARGNSLVDIYTRRIRGVEEASMLRFDAVGSATLPGADALTSSSTWREVQIAQTIHDRRFHPDVFGLSKLDQIRHYTFHVAKLAGLIVEAIEPSSQDGFAEERLADLAVFGVKIATVCNAELSNTPVDSPLALDT